MSFHLVNQPLKVNIPTIQKNTINFVKVLTGKLQLIVVVASNNQIFVYDFVEGNELGVIQMYYKSEKMTQRSLDIYDFEDKIWILTWQNIFAIEYDQIRKTVARKNNKIDLNRLIIKKEDHEFVKYDRLMNKQIKIVAHNDKKYLKLLTKSKNAIIYYCGVLLSNYFGVKTTIEYQITASPLFNASIQCSDLDLLIYNSFTNKSRPIPCNVHEFIISNDDYNHLEYELKINHFLKNVTVSRAFKINNNLLCLFCNEIYEESTSCMIVYNYREKFTQNYLTFNHTTISKVIMSHKQNQKNKCYFQAFQMNGKQSRYFWLTSGSYLQKQDIAIKGNYVCSDINYLAVQESSHLKIYPKINKKSLYSYFLNHFLPGQSETHSLVLSLL